VINDLATDQRVLRTCSVLKEKGFEVILFGRELKNSPSVSSLPYKTKRVKMLFTSGPLFYFFFNLRLYFFLLLTHSDVLYSNDLDTLWANFRISKLKKIPLIYDSHELFCEVPELQNHPTKKSIWESLEKRIVPQLKHCITVNQSIAGIFKNKYGIEFKVVRNIPASIAPFPLRSKQELGISPDKKVIILQGSGINIQRGAEELVQAMQFVEAQLFIIGGGDVFGELKKMVEQLNLGSKVIVKDKMPKSELVHYTFNADIGVSIDKDTNLNYHYSLPNKIFDYIQAGLPVLASPLPEIKNIISRYNIGAFIENHDPKHLAERLNCMLNSNEFTTWKENTKKAAAENNWENEKKVLNHIIENLK
jgi:glycosyltransferase involved in cell wall biosynthesis